MAHVIRYITMFLYRNFKTILNSRTELIPVFLCDTTIRLNENADPQRSLNAETSISFHSGEEETSSNIRVHRVSKIISFLRRIPHDSKFPFFSFRLHD